MNIYEREKSGTFGSKLIFFFVMSLISL